MSLCMSAHNVYCGKTAEWIRMPFVVMSGVSRGMSVLDGYDNRRRGMGSFEAELVAFHYNQWGLCRIVVQKCVNQSSCRLRW